MWEVDNGWQLRNVRIATKIVLSKLRIDLLTHNLSIRSNWPHEVQLLLCANIFTTKSKLDVSTKICPTTKQKLECRMSILGEPQHKQQVFCQPSRTRGGALAYTLRTNQSENTMPTQPPVFKNKPSTCAKVVKRCARTIKSKWTKVSTYVFPR